MIEAHGLTMRYGSTTAVDDISFTIAPGSVTGFLGPNGAGKSTTMRMIVGLDRPTSGTVTVNGKPYAKHRSPLREVGALLDAKAVHPGRSARSHPRTLILDEPVNGLDPEGVQWVRRLVRLLASEGRTVFLSSHLMSEMAQSADQLLVIGRGRIIASGPVQTVIDSVIGASVRVRSPRVGELARLVVGGGVRLTPADDGALDFHGISAAELGDTAAAHGIPVHELSPRSASLEEAYMNLTQDVVEYRSDVPVTTSRKGEVR